MCVRVDAHFNTLFIKLGVFLPGEYFYLVHPPTRSERANVKLLN